MLNNKVNFVSLHNHTQVGSPLDGLNEVKDLFDRAKEINQPGFAISDHGTLAAIQDLYKESKKQDMMKFIPGEEFYFTDDLVEGKNYHLVLLAQNEIGYKNLLRLGFDSYKNLYSGYMGKKIPRISWEHIEKYNEGIFALTACSNGLIAKTLITNREVDKATCYIKRLHSIFKDRFYLEIQPHALVHVAKDGKEVNQVKLNEAMIKISRDLGIPYVITCDAHYKNKDMAVVHDAMLAIKDHKAIDDPDRFRYGVTDMYLKTDEEIVDFFGKDIAQVGMNNSMKIFNSCDYPNYLESRGPILPRFPVKDEPNYQEFRAWFESSEEGIEEDKAYLRYKCIEGFKKKLEGASKEKKKEYWDRVSTELEVLEMRGFSSYMLIVSDYLNWAKNNGVSTGPARGSAAGSLVAYLTGITTVDPIKHGLLFERFHNKEKKAYPDIDSDFSKAKRDLVQGYLKNKYGADKVAYINNWSTLSPKVVIKDVARSLNLGGDKSSAFEIANHITSIMPDEKTIEGAEKMSPQFAGYLKKYPDLKKYGSPLQGIVRNWSVHAAGFVISDKPLNETVPLRIDEDGNSITQWEKSRCEEFGLIKMDLLGIETLDVIDETINNIRLTTGKEVNIETIPLDDADVFAMIGRGETMGVFQLESSLTPLCMEIKPKSIDEISDINALGRPSCSAEQRRDYIDRKNGVRPVSYRHPTLENSLKKTFGISLYEEAMMTVAKDCAGWDLNKADNLRKITKLKGKNPELVEMTKNDFIISSMSHANLKYEEALNIWEKEIEPFGLYGFNKSHSISYSYISYYTAYLRHHFPTEFMCALLNSEDPNGDKAQEYINECQNMGIKITSPDINKSKSNYFISGDKQIATGLAAIKGVGDTAIANIINAQPFNDIKDFFSKIDGGVVNKRVLQSLAKAGAFDSLNRTRKDIHDNYDKYRTKITTAIKKNKNIDEVNIDEYKEEWDKKERLVNEREVLGRTISGSLHEVFEGFFSKDSNLVTRISKLGQIEERKKVKIEAIINSKIKEFKIKNGKSVGKKFAKYLIEDVHGDKAEMTVWANEYEKYRELLIEGTPIKVICAVSEYMGKKGLNLVLVDKIFGKRME